MRFFGVVWCGGLKTGNIHLRSETRDEGSGKFTFRVWFLSKADANEDKFDFQSKLDNLRNNTAVSVQVRVRRGEATGENRRDLECHDKQTQNKTNRN